MATAEIAGGENLASNLKLKGNGYFSMDMYAEAVSCYTQCIEKNPNDHVLFSNRSAAYLLDNKIEEALSDALQCIKLNKEWPKAYSRKGAALHASEKYSEAVATFQKGSVIFACGDFH